MSDDLVARAARAAANELAPQHGARLQAEVEAALLKDGEDTPPQYLDPVSLSGVIVAAAALAYQIWRDHKQGGAKPTKDSLARRTRVEWRKERHLTADAEKVIEIVSAEIVEPGEE